MVTKFTAQMYASGNWERGN